MASDRSKRRMTLQQFKFARTVRESLAKGTVLEQALRDGAQAAYSVKSLRVIPAPVRRALADVLGG